MYSVIVGWSPQTGQSCRRWIRTSEKSVASASKSSSRPISGSPIPSASLSASFVCSEPTIPGSTPSTPPSEHDGASSGGGAAERAAAGRGQVERRRGAEPARADQQDARVEQLELTLFTDLGDQRVPRVAGAALGREHARDGDLEAVALPVREPADQRVD